MGLTNRIASRFADQIYIAFDEAAPKSKGSTTRITGNPVRQNLAESHKQEALDYFEFSDVRQVVFMTGGSIGSQAMNEAMATIVRSLLSKRGIGVIWQTGERYFERFQTSVPDHPRLRLKAYVDRMDMAYSAADLMICRSGASTCSELMLTGTPAILIPSPNVSEDHQTKNALSLVSAGAATLLEETRMHHELLNATKDLLIDTARLDRMSANALKLAKPNAAREIAEDILDLARTRIR
jgi:UDP-N-acetylglucosamine--N-acetylmuramyl-(pentapeptide) pyrophosphoryl-undecaprenol N-acetylglucosamine transferase